MGWINIGGNRFINVAHIISIFSDDERGIYTILLDNGDYFETSILKVNLGISDVKDSIVPYSEKLVF